MQYKENVLENDGIITVNTEFSDLELREINEEGLYYDDSYLVWVSQSLGAFLGNIKKNDVDNIKTYYRFLIENGADLDIAKPAPPLQNNPNYVGVYYKNYKEVLDKISFLKEQPKILKKIY